MGKVHSKTAETSKKVLRRDGPDPCGRICRDQKAFHKSQESGKASLAGDTLGQEGAICKAAEEKEHLLPVKAADYGLNAPGLKVKGQVFRAAASLSLAAAKRGSVSNPARARTTAAARDPQLQGVGSATKPWCLPFCSDCRDLIR